LVKEFETIIENFQQTLVLAQSIVNLPTAYTAWLQELQRRRQFQEDQNNWCKTYNSIFSTLVSEITSSNTFEKEKHVALKEFIPELFIEWQAPQITNLSAPQEYPGTIPVPDDDEEFEIVADTAQTFESKVEENGALLNEINGLLGSIGVSATGPVASSYTTAV